MIGYLCGKVIEKTENSAIILVGGVGYEVSLSTSVLSKLKKDEEASLYTYTHVREDILALFGFATKEELDFFKLLLSVSGIGPKVALAIVSSSPIPKLKDSISRGDSSLLSAVSGVGKKTAEKAVIELKSKIGNVTTGFALDGGETEDVVLALASLGFQRVEAAAAVAELSDDIEGTDAKLKAALKILGGRK